MRSDRNHESAFALHGFMVGRRCPDSPVGEYDLPELDRNRQNLIHEADSVFPGVSSIAFPCHTPFRRARRTDPVLLPAL